MGQMEKNKKGFTLIELVVVIAVLAILAAIAIPVVTGVVNKANEATDVSNAQAYGQAFKMAVAELYLEDKDRLDGYKGRDLTAVFASEALKYAGIDNYGDLKPKQKGFLFYFNQTTSEVICVKKDTQPAGFEVLIEMTKVTSGKDDDAQP